MGSEPGAPPRRTVVLLSLMSVFGSLSLDLYLPGLPRLAADFGVPASTAQLTMTACLLGLAIGQVVVGPLSDRWGRRRPLLAGVTLFVVASALCAAAPSVPALVGLRFVQGLAGAAGIVVSQAVGRDLFDGQALVALYARIVLAIGGAAIAGPVLGGQLARVTTWRGTFVVLAGLGVLLLAAAAALPETLDPGRRSAGGAGAAFAALGRPLRHRLFLGAGLATSLLTATAFAYLSGSTFVLQTVHGLSPQEFSAVFALNSLAFMSAGRASGPLTRRFPTERVLVAGLATAVAGAGLVAASVLLGLGLPPLLLGLTVLLASIGLTGPPAGALALGGFPDAAGAASSLLGLTGFSAGAAAAPLVGLGGAGSAVPFALVLLALPVLAALSFGLLAGPSATRG